MSYDPEVSRQQQELFLQDALQKGMALQQLVLSQGYEVLMATLEDQKQAAINNLLEVLPADNERILAAHSVAFAVSKTIENLKTAIDRAIEAGTQAPERLRELRELDRLQQNTF